MNAADLTKLAVMLLGLAGFGLALYIRSKKSSREKMVCYIGRDCDTVVHSEYSRFFGLPVEVLGMAYYGAIAAAYFSFLVWPQLEAMPAVFGVLALSAAALLFSLYLTFIQGVVLREWCEWCLTSAAISSAIFALAIQSVPSGLIQFLAGVHVPLVALHGLAAAVGVGGATVADILFFKFLKDLRISEEEAGILKSVSQVIWFSLAVLVITGLGLWAPEAAELNQSPKFLAKMVVVAVIIANGSLLNLWIAPRLIAISFGERHEHLPGELRRARRFAFALGAVSLTSWYSAFVLGSLHSLEIGFWPLLGLYFGALAAAVAMSQYLDRSLLRRP